MTLRPGDSDAQPENNMYGRLESKDTIVSQLAQQDKVPWYKKPNLRFLYFLMLFTCLGAEMTSGYDGSIMNGLQAVPSWLAYFNHPRSASLGLMVSMFALGMVAAVPIAPFVVDRIGRRRSLLLGGMVSITGGVLQGFAANFTMFVAARFILGFANIFSVVAASCLVGELSYPKDRVALGGIFFTAHSFGSIVAAGVILNTFAMKTNWGWRIPSFFQAVPSLVQVALIWCFPESPRWLIFTGRKSEALAVLVKYHAEGDDSSEFIKAEYSQIERTLDAGARIIEMNRKQTFSTPGMRKRFIIATFLGLSAQWSGLSLFSYFLSPILESIGVHDNRTKNVVHLSAVSWAFVTGMAASLIAPRYPRRRMYLACAISLFVVLSAFTAANADYSINRNENSAWMVLVLIFLYVPAYTLAIGSLNYTFLAELFPFHVRASGMALFQWWKRSGAFLSQFINPIGIDAMGWRWYIIYCVWCAFQIVFVYVMFPETSGRTLEELMFLYKEDREVLGNDEVQRLSGQGEIVSYGTMEDHS